MLKTKKSLLKALHRLVNLFSLLARSNKQVLILKELKMETNTTLLRLGELKNKFSHNRQMHFLALSSSLAGSEIGLKEIVYSVEEVLRCV